MIRSMTGFGDASCQRDDVHYALELRSLNNRYFKANIRLPDELAGLEAELETQLRRDLRRGSISLMVYRRNLRAGAQTIHEPTLRQYLDQLKRLTASDGKPGEFHVDLAGLLALPGVVQGPDQTQLIAQARPVLLELIEAAGRKVSAMRQTEGCGLAKDLAGHIQAIQERLQFIRPLAPAVVESYHLRLRARMDLLLARAGVQAAQVDLIKEVALYAQRCDISEEIQRLQAHLDQFRALMNGPDEAVGKTLEFLTQEMLREANTIASKADDARITQLVVEIKTAIDRTREQVLNVE